MLCCVSLEQSTESAELIRDPRAMAVTKKVLKNQEHPRGNLVFVIEVNTALRAGSCFSLPLVISWLLASSSLSLRNLNVASRGAQEYLTEPSWSSLPHRNTPVKYVNHQSLHRARNSTGQESVEFIEFIGFVELV